MIGKNFKVWNIQIQGLLFSMTFKDPMNPGSPLYRVGQKVSHCNLHITSSNTGPGCMFQSVTVALTVAVVFVC